MSSHNTINTGGRSHAASAGQGPYSRRHHRGDADGRGDAPRLFGRIGSGDGHGPRPLSGPITMAATVWNRFEQLHGSDAGALTLKDLTAASHRPRSDAVGLHGSLILASSNGTDLFVGKTRQDLLSSLWESLHASGKSPEVQRDLRMALRATPRLAPALVALKPSQADATRAQLAALQTATPVPRRTAALQGLAIDVAVWQFLASGTVPSPPTKAFLDALLACGLDVNELAAIDSRSQLEETQTSQVNEVAAARRSDELVRTLARATQQLFITLSDRQSARIDPSSLRHFLQSAGPVDGAPQDKRAVIGLAQALLGTGKGRNGPALFARLANGGPAITASTLQAVLAPLRTMTT